MAPTELKTLGFASSQTALAVVATLSSSTFFWFWNVLSDCRNMNRRDILAFTLHPDQVSPAQKKELAKRGSQYLEKLKGTSRVMLKSGLSIETFDYAECKTELDSID